MRPAYVIVAGGGIIIVGSLLPWGTLTAGFMSGSVSGIEGDGLITLGLGLVILVLGIVATSRGATPGLRTGAMVLGMLAGGIAAATWIRVAGALVGDFGEVRVGAGLPVVIVGGVVTLVGAILRDAVERPAMAVSEPGETDDEPPGHLGGPLVVVREESSNVPTTWVLIAASLIVVVIFWAAAQS